MLPCVFIHHRFLSSSSNLYISVQSLRSVLTVRTHTFIYRNIKQPFTAMTGSRGRQEHAEIYPEHTGRYGIAKNNKG